MVRLCWPTFSWCDLSGNLDKLLYSTYNSGAYSVASRYNDGALTYGQYWLYVDSGGTVHKREPNTDTPLNEPNSISYAYLCMDSNKKVCKFSGIPKGEYKYETVSSGSTKFYKLSGVTWSDRNFVTFKYNGPIFIQENTYGSGYTTDYYGQQVHYINIYDGYYYLPNATYDDYMDIKRTTDFNYGGLYARYDDVIDYLDYAETRTFISCIQQS